jgi:Domain of unknown function (DUF4907)
MRLISQLSVIFLLLWSCSASSSKENMNEQSFDKNSHQERKSSSTKQSLQTDQFDIQTLQTANGWGYQISQNGKMLIDQQSIPGRAGIQGFQTENDARNVANLVCAKLKAKIFPPTVSEDDLKNLNIH